MTLALERNDEAAGVPAPVTLDLGILERIALFSALPETLEASFDTLRAARQLREALTLTEEERAESGFRQEDQQWKWERNIIRPFAFTPSMRTLVLHQLETLSAKGQARDWHLALYERLNPQTGG